MMLIKAHQDASYIFSSLAAILSVFVTQAFIFGPKIRALLDTDMLPDLLEKANIKQHLNSTTQNSLDCNNKLRVSRESSRKKRQAAHKKAEQNAAAAEVEYNELVAENEDIKRQIADVGFVNCLNKPKRLKTEEGKRNIPSAKQTFRLTKGGNSRVNNKLTIKDL